MKQAVANTSQWILDHMSKSMPLSVKYVKTAVVNQCCMTQATRGITLDEHELFNQVVAELDNAGVSVKGLTPDEYEEIFGKAHVPFFRKAGTSEFPLDITEADKITHDEDCVIKLGHDNKFSDLFESDLWGWLYDVFYLAENRGCQEITFSAKY